MIQIDKNIPIPNENRPRNAKYPLDVMEIGDSFYVDAAELGISTDLLYSRLYSSISKRRKNGADYIMRREKQGYRIWRTK